MPFKDGDEYQYEQVDVSSFDFDEHKMDDDLSRLPDDVMRRQRKAKNPPSAAQEHIQSRESLVRSVGIVHPSLMSFQTHCL